MAEANSAMIVDTEGTMASTLFAQVCFHIIETDIPALDVGKIRDALVSNGATEHTGSPSRNVNFELEGLSHVVAASIDFEGYSKQKNASSTSCGRTGSTTL